MNRKFIIVLISCLILGSFNLFAQQITKFGVVDTNRVYQSYFRDSGPVRNYESKKSEYQQEIASLTQELQELHNKKLEYQRNGEEAQALKIDTQITKKADYLKEYTNAKNIELESLLKSLQNNDSFYQKLYSTLEKIAESGGYSMILSLQQSEGILWYSSSIDITDDVIAQLGIGR